MRYKHSSFAQSIFVAILIALCLSIFVQAQKTMDRIERGSMKDMLGAVKNDVKKNYYDTNYHGVDLDARFEAAKKRLDEVNTTSEALSVIAQVLLDFNDSHLFFLPPATNIDVEYGYRTLMIGDDCIVTTVKPKSDAEKKGLRPGDELISIEGFPPSRKDMWKINYFFNILSKRGTLNLKVLKPDSEKPVDMQVEAEVEQQPRVLTAASIFWLYEPDTRTQFEINLSAKFGDIAYWKLPSFSMDPNNIDSLIGRIGSAQSLILDLRGNGGGAVVTLERLASYLFDKDLLIATPKGRKKFDVTESKTKGSGAFKGRLIVLIDSNSGSASEVFARIVQIEQRGVVLGDVSAGAVMMSRQFVNSLRNDSIFYGSSITLADVIMPDGNSLENIGVIPTARILPKPEDVANAKDPLLSEAVKLLGGDLTPEAAGAMFEYDWLKNGIVVVKLAEKK